jgi:hypothetical protein
MVFGNIGAVIWAYMTSSSHVMTTIARSQQAIEISFKNIIFKCHHSCRVIVKVIDMYY